MADGVEPGEHTSRGRNTVGFRVSDGREPEFPDDRFRAFRPARPVARNRIEIRTVANARTRQVAFACAIGTTRRRSHPFAPPQLVAPLRRGGAPAPTTPPHSPA